MNYSKLLLKLMNKKPLNQNESRYFIESIIKKDFSDVRSGAALIALQNKGVTPKELASFVKTLKKHAITINPKSRPLIDTCGTGGDKSNTFNISTVTAFVLAASGINVAKHGNKSVSSKCGSADVLESLGINIHLKTKQVEECINKIGIGFMFAPNHHPAFKNIAPIRQELGVRTVFNMLGPLLNPASAEYQLIGVYDPDLTETYGKTLIELGIKNAMVVHGSGLDEIAIHDKTKITQLKNNKIKTYEINPIEFGIKKSKLSEITCNNIQENKQSFLDILEGKQSPKLDIVLLNAAAGLIIADKAKDFREGIEIARQTIKSGKAKQKFNELMEYTNDIR